MTPTKLVPAVPLGVVPPDDTAARALLIVDDLLARAVRTFAHQDRVEGDQAGFHAGRREAYLDAVALLTGIPHRMLREDVARRAGRP